MLRLHEGWDYTLYKFYIAAGLAALMGIPILAALLFGDRVPYADYGVPYMIGLTGWILGILIYWWWVFLLKDSQALQVEASQATSTTPSIRALQNLNRLHRAMTIHGGDIEAWEKARWAGKRPALEFYGWLNLLVLWIFGAVWAAMLDLFPAVDPAVVPAGVVLIAVILIIRTYAGLQGSAEGFAEAYLKPLGLQVANRPAIKPRPLALLTGGQAVVPTGSAVLEGVRASRSVRIELLDQHSRTLVRGTTPSFVLDSPAGKIRAARDAPAAVHKAVKGLRKARRWRGLQVEGGPDGIEVFRKSRRQNMWLYDLWLAEYLFEMLGERQAPVKSD